MADVVGAPIPRSCPQLTRFSRSNWQSRSLLASWSQYWHAVSGGDDIRHEPVPNLAVEASTAGPPRPPFTLCVGVTGHRADVLPARALAPLRTRIRDVLLLL